MHSVATYSVATVHQVLAEVTTGKRATLPDGRTFNRRSDRLVLFSTQGVTCVTCGLAGSYYSLEAHQEGETPHLNLYALSPLTGKPVLMTKDHVLPKSKGGANAQANYVPMCSPCNRVKADRLPEAA